VKKVKIVVNTKKPQAKSNLGHAEQMIRAHGFVISEQPDFVVALGGDGTLLAAAHAYGKRGIPLLGVNIGGLGFLTTVPYDKLSKTLDDIARKKYRIEKRMVLRAVMDRKSSYALNDFTISTRVPGRAVEFSAVINNEYVCRFVADGIIVATPTGSTAYSLATGGPILLPDTEAIILTPIAPHTLSVRPIVLPATSTVKIQIGKKGSAVLVADGQRRTLIRREHSIICTKADYYVRLIKPLHTTFFTTLREKMQWGGREDA